MNIQASSHPGVALPNLEIIGHTKIREAIANFVDTERRVRDGHDVDGRLKAGHRLDELTPEQIAEAVATARNADGLRAEATNHLVGALGEHHGAWLADATARRDKAAAQVIKTAKAALAAISEFELLAGVLRMIEDTPGRPTWRAPREGAESHEAGQSLQALIDRLARDTAAE
jgi:hypothetical protein